MVKNWLRSVTAVFLIAAACFLFATWGCKDQDPGEAGKTESAAIKGEDQGKNPWVVDIESITIENSKFRVVRWTGKYLQMTLMSIKQGGEIGLERHNDVDQFLRIEKGKARVFMGQSKDDMSYKKEVGIHWSIFIPAGYWHNITNIGKEDLKLYSIYSPVQHPAGTVHETFKDAEAADH